MTAKTCPDSSRTAVRCSPDFRAPHSPTTRSYGISRVSILNIMYQTESEKYLYDILKEGDVWQLKRLLKEIQDDYENPCEDLQKRCSNVSELESYLKDRSYLYFLESGKVARFKEEYETGQENAVNFFAEKLEAAKRRISFQDLRKHVDDAPTDVKEFIDTFYPKKEFKRFLQLRPHVFIVFDDNTVHLIETVTVNYFKEKLKESGEGLQYTRFRGHVAQAPDQIRSYVNTQYPGGEFRKLLDRNSDVFNVNSSGRVYLVK